LRLTGLRRLLPSVTLPPRLSSERPFSTRAAWPFWTRTASKMRSETAGVRKVRWRKRMMK